MSVRESPEYVRISLAAAIALGFARGSFYRGAVSYCVNLLLTYEFGCVGRCAYCGLSVSRRAQGSWRERSFIRVDWPTVRFSDVLGRLEQGACPCVERVCISMVTYGRARRDALYMVEKLSEVTDSISVLVSPMIVDRAWLRRSKELGADKIGVAVDAATRELFDKLRGKGVGAPLMWDKYWRVVEEAVDVFGPYNVGVHFIVGLGETEREMVEAIQRAYDIGALTHLFSFFPEEGSLMEDHPQPPIGQYRRIQLARYLINKGIARAEDMEFDDRDRLVSFGVEQTTLNEVIDSGLPFMTSGCPSKNRENACNRPFSNCTPYQAMIGELRNFPFRPTPEDIAIIRRQLADYSDVPVKVWVDAF